jgi:aminoglycoside phosphotransferase (APT) family kinase protein
VTAPGKSAVTFGEQAYAWLAQTLGVPPGKLDLERMKGSTSSSVFLIRCARGNALQKFVLRVLNNPSWLTDEPDLAAHEAAALEEAQRAGLRAPRLVAYASDEVGFGAPVVLMSFIEGEIELRPVDFGSWLEGLAHELALIHQHPAHTLQWRYESWVEREKLAIPAWTKRPHLWERAIELVRGVEPDARQVFIHRDYHPTNVLWTQGSVSGVVDWINACRGPAGVDVAHCRTNLALLFGPAVADEFLETYCKIAAGFEYHPYWDVDGLLDMSLPTPEFYPPWKDFGLGDISAEVLQQRADAYLESVMRDSNSLQTPRSPR